MLTPNKMISCVQQILQPMFEMLDMTVSTQEIRSVLRQDEQTYVRQTLSSCAKRTLREIENKTIDQHIEMFEAVLSFAGRYANVLRSETIEIMQLTVENYPRMAYPIYIYYLFNFMIHARQINAEHLDNSYWRDFRYLHYLNFCDIFIANEKSTRHIVNSIPYDDIRETHVITAEELKGRLN